MKAWKRVVSIGISALMVMGCALPALAAEDIIKKPANKKSSPLSQKYERKRMEKVNTANRPPPKSGSQEEKIISVSPSQTRPRVPSL